MNKLRLVILDRDGVINHDSSDYIKSPAEWLPIAGSLAAIARLKQAGLWVAVATNQSGINRGYYSHDTLRQIHLKMQAALHDYQCAIDAINYCPHLPTENCLCRKPKPTMLQHLAHYFQVPLSQTIMIGDSLKDIQAAQTAGCSGWVVKTGNGEETAKHLENTHIPVYDDLASAVEALLC